MIILTLDSGVATGGMGGSGLSLIFRSLLRLAQIRGKVFLYIGGGRPVAKGGHFGAVPPR